MMREVGAFTVPADHPCLAGHFPGRPIVPGVVLLDAVAAMLRAAGRLDRIGQAKFVGPVLPGQTVSVQCGPPATSVAFEAAVGGRTVLRGQLSLAP